MIWLVWVTVVLLNGMARNNFTSSKDLAGSSAYFFGSKELIEKVIPTNVSRCLLSVVLALSGKLPAVLGQICVCCSRTCDEPVGSST